MRARGQAQLVGLRFGQIGHRAPSAARAWRAADRPGATPPAPRRPATPARPARPAPADSGRAPRRAAPGASASAPARAARSWPAGGLDARTRCRVVQSLARVQAGALAAVALIAVSGRGTRWPRAGLRRHLRQQAAARRRRTRRARVRHRTRAPAAAGLPRKRRARTARQALGLQRGRSASSTAAASKRARVDQGGAGHSVLPERAGHGVGQRRDQVLQHRAFSGVDQHFGRHARQQRELGLRQGLQAGGRRCPRAPGSTAPCGLRSRPPGGRPTPRSAALRCAAGRAA